MLEHVVDKDRPAEGNVIRVIERDVVVQSAITKVEAQDRPAAAAPERIGDGTKVAFPLIEGTILVRDSLLQRPRRFAISAQVSEILFVQDDGIRRDEFLHLESFDLESRSILRKRRKHLFDLSQTTERARIVVVVM